jgi:outer membrane protein assembly factor BamB
MEGVIMQAGRYAAVGARSLAGTVALAGVLLLAGCEDGSDGADGEPSGPIISNISTVGSPIYPGGQVEVHVSASSPSGGTLEYDWTIPDGWDGSDTGDDMLVITAPDDQAARGEVGVAVTDGERSRSASVQVATRGPAIESFSVEPLPSQAGDTATFTTEAYNRDGNPLIYHYAVGNLVFAERGPLWDWTATQRAMGGRYRLGATVEDGNGLTARAGVETTIEGVSEWPAFGGDRQRSGRSPSPDAEGAVGNLIWDSGTVIGDRVYSSPALGADGTIYIGSLDNKVYALDPADGSELWSFTTGDRVSSSPAVGADGTVYVGSLDSNVYALEPADGSERWSFTTGDAVTSSPALGADGTIYVGSYDNKVYALDPADGSERWSFTTGDSVESSPALGADGTAYVGSHDNKVYAIR